MFQEWDRVVCVLFRENKLRCGLGRGQKAAQLQRATKLQYPSHTLRSATSTVTHTSFIALLSAG